MQAGCAAIDGDVCSVGYDKQDDTLYIEAAVPEKITQSDAARRYMALMMVIMVDNAKASFIEMDIDFDINNWRREIDDLTAARTRKAVTY